MFKIVLRRIAALLYLALRVAGGWLRKRALRIIALTYLAILVVLPVLWIFHEAFASGLQAVWMRPPLRVRFTPCIFLS